MRDPVPALKAFTVDGERLDLQYLLNAPYEDIREAAEKIPAAIGWLGYQRAYALERLIIAEQAWKEVESTEYFEMKMGRFESQGFGGKMTEDALKRALPLTETVKAACRVYAEKKRNVERLTTAIDALHAKLDLVRSSETTRRMEHELEQNKRTIV